MLGDGFYDSSKSEAFFGQILSARVTDFVGVLAERIDTLTWRVLIFACDGLELIVGLGSSLEFVFWDCLCARVWWIGSCGDLGAWGASWIGFCCVFWS